MGPFLHLGRAYLRWSASRRLDGVYVDGLGHARAALARGPVIFAANHVSWWDGPLGVLADAATGADSRYLVDADNLARVPFLRWFGAVDLDRSSPLASRHGLARAAAHLDGPGRAVWIYPQGRQRPAHLRPLGLQPGWSFLARRSGAAVVPVAVQYGFREDHRPTAALSFGPADPPELEPALLALLAGLDGFFDGGEPPPALIAPRGARVDAGVGARLLALGAPR